MLWKQKIGARLHNAAFLRKYSDKNKDLGEAEFTQKAISIPEIFNSRTSSWISLFNIAKTFSLPERLTSRESRSFLPPPLLTLGA